MWRGLKTIFRGAKTGGSAPALSKRPKHYTDRAECIGFFSEVYGYNPLVVAEYRADSVLYNMPGQKGMCFSGTR